MPIIVDPLWKASMASRRQCVHGDQSGSHRRAPAVSSKDLLPFQSMKVKLQPPSGTELSAFSPIQPPAAITQVMLLANPLKVS